MKPKMLIFNSIHEQHHLRFRSQKSHGFSRCMSCILYLHSGVKTNVCLKAKPHSLSIIKTDNYSETLTTGTGVTHISLSEQDNYMFPLKPSLHKQACQRQYIYKLNVKSQP